MKIFGLIIIKQKTMDNLCERLAEDCKDACVEAAKQARVIPNKIISKLLWEKFGKHRDSLIQAYRESRMFKKVS